MDSGRVLQIIVVIVGLVAIIASCNAHMGEAYGSREPEIMSLDVWTPVKALTHSNWCVMCKSEERYATRIFEGNSLCGGCYYTMVSMPVNLWKGIVAEVSRDLIEHKKKPIWAVMFCLRNRINNSLPLGLVALDRKNLNRFVKKELAYLEHRTGVDYEVVTKDIIKKVLFGNYVDTTNGATYYENIEDFDLPEWTFSMRKTVKIGSHTFYKETRNE